MEPTPIPTTDAKTDLVEWHRLHDALVKKYTAKHPFAFRRAFREQYRYDAPAFVRECLTFLPGEKITDYQNTALEMLMEKRRLAVRSLHGTGKSTQIGRAAGRERGE